MEGLYSDFFEKFYPMMICHVLARVNLALGTHVPAPVAVSVPGRSEDWPQCMVCTLSTLAGCLCKWRVGGPEITARSLHPRSYF